jgi:hypothetical protein
MRWWHASSHHNPKAAALTPYVGGELLWKFTKAGTFEYGCLNPAIARALRGSPSAGPHLRLRNRSPLGNLPGERP